MDIAKFHYLSSMQQLCALLLILPLSPLLLIVMIVVWIVERERPVFLQERIGFHKEPFTIYKLRTMKKGNITWIGKILRKTGIDELPQLFNIAMGEMNFVGPRPLTFQDIDRLGWTLNSYAKRWSVKPGITGLAQLVNVCDADVSWQNDHYYIENRSTMLDAKILFRSLLVPFVGKASVKKILNNSIK